MMPTLIDNILCQWVKLSNIVKIPFKSLNIFIPKIDSSEKNIDLVYCCYDLHHYNRQKSSGVALTALPFIHHSYCKFFYFV